MPVLARLASVCRNLFRRADVEARLDAEIRAYVDLLAEEKVRAGMPPAEARLAALRETGSIESVKQATREGRAGAGLDVLFQDLGYAGRTLARRPGFTAAVMLSLALGVAATTSVYSVVSAVLLRPLPYVDADRLHEVRIAWGDFSSSFSAADRLALRETSAPLGDAGGYYAPDDGFALATAAGPEVVRGALVTPELPRLLGVQPSRGRLFTENGQAEPIEALVSDRFWRTHLDGTAEVVGRGLLVDGDAVMVVGVMPPGFAVGNQQTADIWIRFEPSRPTRRGAFYLNAIARLAPGVTPDEAAARFTDRVTPLLRDRFGVTEAWRYEVRPLKDALVGNIRPTLRLLFAAVALVLLVGVLNGSNLLLARGMTRRHELGVRAALGAGRGRLVRQLVVEAALLGSFGAAAGLLLAALALRLGAGTLGGVVPRIQEVRLDGAVVAFALAVGIGAGILAGILPAWRIPWTSLVQGIREGERGTGGGHRQNRTRRVMVMAEVALTLTIVAGATLLVKSLRRLEAADPGFDSRGVLTFRVSLPEATYPDSIPDRAAGFFGALLPALRNLPGVTAAGLSGALPPDDLQIRNNYTVEGTEQGGRGPGDVAEWIVVDTGYFSAMRIPVLRGRQFGPGDRDSAPPVVVVNQSFARRHFGAGTAVGKRLKGGDWDPEAPWLTIVGVVGDVAYSDGLAKGVEPTVYLAHAQNLWLSSPFLVVRAAETSGLVSPIRGAVTALDPAIPLRDVATLEERLRDSVAAPRLRSMLFATLALVALALALTGIYGVLAYEVSLRARETAVRLALGASTADVVRMIVADGLRLSGIGMVLGIGGAVALARALSAFLYGVKPFDPSGLAVAVGIMLAAAVAACLIPARSAARTEPIDALRAENG